jgi:hypothetical protein
MKFLFFLFPFLTLSNIINILHLSDIHYDQLYNIGSPNNCEFGTKIGTLCCHKYNIPLKPFQPAKKYGDFHCDSPYDLIKETLKWINSSFTIDAIFWGGDTVNHHDFIQLPISNLKLISNITREIKHYFPKSILIPVIGNHDIYPIDQFSSKLEIHQYMLKVLSEMWNINSKDFLKYGFYSTDFYTIKLIVLNSGIWDIHNIVGNFTDDSIIQYQWLNDQLNNTKKHVWIIGHLPPTSHETNDFFSDRFEPLMNLYKEKISYSFWYHTHTDEYFVIKDKSLTDSVSIIKNKENKTAIGIGFILPSIVPLEHYSAFRIYQYNTSSNEILNYQNYYINLTSINELKENFQYNMELKISNLNNMAYSMIKNDTLYNIYCKNYYSGYINNRCDNQKLRMNYICDILYISHEERKNCKL